MAKWIGSAMVTAASGHVGGVVFRNARGGGVIAIKPRNRAISTPAQRVRVQSMATAQSNWRALDEATRRAWNTAAGLRSYPDHLGVKRNISGYQLFLKQSLCFFGTSYATTSLPPYKETPGLVSLATTQNLNFLRVWPTLASNPGGNIVVVISGVRPGTNAPITRIRQWQFVSASAMAPGGYVSVSGSQWQYSLDYQAGEKMLLRVYCIALDSWVSNKLDLEVEWA